VKDLWANNTGVGRTDGYLYDIIFIMVDISEVLCGARNDKSPEAVPWPLKCCVGARSDKSPEVVAWTPEL